MLIPSELNALVVDDNDYGRVLSEQSLKQLGISNVFGAKDAVSALETLKANKIDFVLLDWYMPEVNGAGFARIVRKGLAPCSPDLPIIVTTAYATKENTSRIRELKLKEILVKPFNLKQLSAALSIAISQMPPATVELVDEANDEADQYVL